MKESELVTKIKNYLNANYACYFIKIHGSQYTTPGVSDLIGVFNGKFFAFEVKLPNKEKNLTKAQKLFLDLIRKSGGIAHVITSIDQIKNIINEYM